MKNLLTKCVNFMKDKTLQVLNYTEISKQTYIQISLMLGFLSKPMGLNHKMLS